jgi:hypothetical protein
LLDTKFEANNYASYPPVPVPVPGGLGGGGIPCPPVSSAFMVVEGVVSAIESAEQEVISADDTIKNDTKSTFFMTSLF